MFTLANYREISLDKFGGLFTEADPSSLPPGASPQCWDVDFVFGGVGTRSGLSNPITSISPPLTNYPIEYLKSTQVLGPKRLTLMEDGGTSLYQENIDTAPTVFTGIYGNILNHARALSWTVNQREYIGLSDLTQGTDQPRQYDGTNLDRISQVGPGAAPNITVTSPTYPILSITEIYPAVSIDSISWGSSINLHAATPPSANLYFLGSVGSTSFTINLNLNDLVYISGNTTLEGQNPNGTYADTSIGFFTDGDGTRQYFGVTANVANSDFARGGAGGTYQITTALVQLSTPIPLQNSVVGGKITIQGASVPQWNQTWAITATPTEGQLSIGATSITANVATYDYSLQSGEAPGWQPGNEYTIASQIVSPNGDVWQITTPGTSGGSIPAFVTSPQTDGTATWTIQPGTTMVLATVFNTNNGNGIFNIQNQTITSATQTTFTVAITSPDIGSAAEDGQAVTGSGTAIIIDPGLITLGTGNPGVNPIYGDSTGGNVLVSNPAVAAGQRYIVLMFLTRNGYITPASPPRAFFTTGESGQLSFSDIAIGPPDVIARIFGITLANAGIGGPYFWVPDDVVIPGSAASLGATQTFNKTVLDDNTSTTFGPITLSDAILAASQNISEEGNNLQQQRELGEFVKVVQWAGRCFYLGERVKVDQFYNMTFDGGEVNNLPAGWTVSAGLSPYTTVVVSPIVNTSLQIHNTSGGVLNDTGTTLANMLTLSQTAYETPFLSPIIQPNTAYSVRVTASYAHTLAQFGNLVVELYSPLLATSWSFSVPLASLTANMLEFIGPLNNPLWQEVPSDLEARFYPTLFPNTSTMLVDRIEFFPTQQPVYTLQVAVSYAENEEAIDGVTGALDTSLLSSKVETNEYILLNKLYLATASETFTPIQSGSGEPSSWIIDEISNAVGSVGPMANDIGEEYNLVADDNGAYIFDGGNHLKFTQEVQKIWNLKYELSKKTIWILNDLKQQRILIGLPLPTPNFWLPNAPTNATPATPNVIMMVSYLGLMTGAEIANGMGVHVSQYGGVLTYHDGRRKPTLWQIPSATAAWIDRPDGSQEVWFGQVQNV